MSTGFMMPIPGGDSGEDREETKSEIAFMRNRLREAQSLAGSVVEFLKAAYPIVGPDKIDDLYLSLRAFMCGALEENIGIAEAALVPPLPSLDNLEKLIAERDQVEAGIQQIEAVFDSMREAGLPTGLPDTMRRVSLDPAKQRLAGLDERIAAMQKEIENGG